MSCGERALSQRSGTCWLNSVMNALFLSSHMYDDLVKMYYKQNYSDDDIRILENIIKMKQCLLPKNTPELRDSVRYYIFAFIHYFLNRQIRSTTPYSPLEYKSRLIKRFYNDDEDVNVGFHPHQAMKLIFDILFNTTVSYNIGVYRYDDKTYSLTTDRLRDKDEFLEAVIINLNTGDIYSHAVSVFRCDGVFYLYDSNYKDIIEFDILDSNWRTKLIKIYGNDTSISPYPDFYIYRMINR